MIFSKIRKIISTPVNPSFTIKKRGLRGSKLYRRVFVMGISVAVPLRLFVLSSFVGSVVHTVLVCVVILYI